MAEIIEFNGRRYTPLFADVFRPLSPAELERLDKSIAEIGIRYYIVADDSADVAGVIDGWHRLVVAERQDLPPSEVPIEICGGLSAELKRKLALALNDARRQMAPEDRREMVERLAALGKSKRSIARELGVDPKTVRNDMQRSGGESSPPERQAERPQRVVGADGKRYRPTPPTDEEVERRRVEVLRRHDACQTVAEVAASLGVSTGTVMADWEAAQRLQCPHCKAVAEAALFVPARW